jgi:flavin reductase (DIM6/NTAB) family NADH-FMN oxidoreductase RutF
VRGEHVDAPYIQECPLVLECRVIHVFELGLRTQFVGQILDVKAEESVLGSDGAPDMAKIRPILFSPGDRRYYGVGPSLGLAFAVGKEI